jgi:hypothetical protein
MRSIKESVLLKTSSNTDVQCSGGVVSITGLDPVLKKNITSIVQIKYRAATAQVITVGATSYTPTASTRYAVAVYDPNRVRDGYQEAPRVYAYTTPADILLIGDTAALQREAIHAALVLKINADSGINHTTAASLGTGTGFTITDNTDYYPIRSQSMTNEKFVTTILAETNPDGTGFASTNVTVTTVGQTSFGVGAKLAQQLPVVDNMYGNLVSGTIEAPPLATDGTAATSGQNYDGFSILSLKDVPAHNVTGQLAYVPREQLIYVDNGSGTSTTNLAGFLTFEREMRKLITWTYKNDESAVIQWFDQDFVEQGLLGAAPATTAGVANKFLTPYGMLNHFNIGTQTIVTGTQANAGFLMEQDATATEGAAYTAPIWTVNSQQFVVGKTAMTVNAKVSFTTPANIVFMVGFRSKEAHQAAFASYQYLATAGLGASGTAFSTYGNLAAGTPVVTANGSNALTTVAYDFRIQIDINGLVTAYINNVKSNIYSVGTTALVIPAGTIMIPHMQYTNLNSAAAVPTVSQLWAVASDLVIN